jgi:hypothetical protein
VRSCITDTANLAGWSAAQLSRRPDLWIVGSTSADSLIASLPARKLVTFQPGVLLNGYGLPAGVYNTLLASAAAGAVTTMNLTDPDPANGSVVKFIDLTRRGVPQAIAALLLAHFPSVDGIHMDYWTGNAWRFGSVTPTGEPPDTYWPKYVTALAQIPAILHASRPSILIVGQANHLDTDGAMNYGINGLFLEQSYTSFGMTPLQHEQDKATLTQLQHSLGRESLWIAELAEPEKWPAWYISAMASWADAKGFYLSYGQGSQAKVM